MIRRWTKVWTLGDRYTKDIWDGPVSITEKLDGSQLNFGVDTDGTLKFLTKGSTIYQDSTDKLFSAAVKYIVSIQDKLFPGVSYHGECLCSPRQNTLVYGRTPTNYIALYGITLEDGSQVSEYNDIKTTADSLGIDTVKQISSGVFSSEKLFENLNSWLNMESQLGKEKIEGIVIKNYTKEQFVGGVLFPLIQAKFVSEKFKERHSVEWPKNNLSPLEAIGGMVRTEARWHKAIQRLRESGELEQSPRDIGKLLSILHTDIEEEDKETIKDMLWNHFNKDIKRAAIRGFPEAYKYYLATGELSMDNKT